MPIKQIKKMKNESRIVELLSEMLHKFDVLTDEVVNLKVEMVGVKNEVKGVKDEVKEVKYEVYGLNGRMSKVEEEIVKLNLISAENSRSLMKLADNHERINRLEMAVFK